MSNKPEITLNEDGSVKRIRVPAGQYLERNLNHLFNHTTNVKVGYLSVCKTCGRFYPTPRPTLEGYCPGCLGRMNDGTTND